MTLPEFTPGLAAPRVDESLRLAVAAADHAQECAVLWFAEIARRSLFRELGFASLELYATESLGFSRNRYFQFARLAEDLDRLPHLREAVVGGEIGWTKAQQVARVATAASEIRWVARAATVSRRELEAEVRQARVKAKQRRVHTATRQLEFENLPAEAPVADLPTTLALRLDGVQLARYEALVERTHKLGLVPAGATREEVMLAGLSALVESGEDLRRRNSRKSLPGAQIVVRRCPDCDRRSVVTSQGEKALDPNTAEALACDALVREDDGPNRSTIPPAVRAKVLARDGHRCTSPGCGSTRFLEVHHLAPRSQGGSNRVENLVTLCSRCHRFTHARGPAG
jgi:5-methylcytosine-specific restriction endonuclease McrA